MYLELEFQQYVTFWIYLVQLRIAWRGGAGFAAGGVDVRAGAGGNGGEPAAGAAGGPGAGRAGGSGRAGAGDPGAGGQVAGDCVRVLLPYDGVVGVSDQRGLRGVCAGGGGAPGSGAKALFVQGCGGCESAAAADGERRGGGAGVGEDVRDDLGAGSGGGGAGPMAGCAGSCGPGTR
jgi:hypothetical protein